MSKALILFLLCLLAPTAALADIELAPLRNVLTAEHREATFTVSNPTRRILDGRVSWIDLTATEKGYAHATPETRAKMNAAPYLTVSPAQFRLKPGAQIIITVKLKAGLTPPPGERRSHLLIETGAARTLIRKASDKGLQVDIEAGVSAPVILRGQGRAAAAIGETKLLRDHDGLLMVSAAITPLGDQSTYGRLTATYQPVDGSAATAVLGVRENVAGYPDAAQRVVEIPFGSFSLEAGELTLRYEGEAEFDGQVFDERSFDIAPPQ